MSQWHFFLHVNILCLYNVLHLQDKYLVIEILTLLWVMVSYCEAWDFIICVFIIIIFYPTWLDFSQLSHVNMANFHTYKSFHNFTNSMGGWVLPMKWIASMLDNDSNDNGNISKVFTTFSRSCEKLITFPFNACWHIFPPLFEYLNLINMVQQRQRGIPSIIH
jgi:hypothetical protein